MADAFDPYYRWLGIPSKEQPPDHYRLLGVERFEENADVIDAASDQRMGFLRNYQTGPHSEQSQKLLNEVAAARVCLLNAGKKAAYDAELRAKLSPATAPKAIPVAQPLPAAPKAALPPPKEEGMPRDVSPAPVEVRAHYKPRRTRKMTWTAPVVAIAVGALVVVGVLVAMSAKNGPPGARRPEDDRTASPSRPPDEGNAPSSPEDDPLQPKPASGSKPDAEVPGEDGPEEADGARPEEEPPDLPNPGPADQDGPPDAIPTPRPSAPPRLAKDPVPSEDELASARQRIDSMIEDHDAGRLLAAADAKSNLTDRYILLVEARDRATAAGNAVVAFQAVDQLDETFSIDAVGMKADVLEQVEDKAELPAHHAWVVQQAIELTDRAISEDRYDTGLRVAELARDHARRTRVPVLVDQTVKRREEAEAMAEAQDQLAGALAALEKNSKDAEANLTAGRFYVGLKGDWSKGLPMLRQSSNTTWKSLAKLETTVGDSASEQAKLGDGWWKLAEQSDGLMKERLQLRAGHWYARALAGLNGMIRGEVEKRLDTLCETPAYALSFDGVDDYVSVPTFSYDGTHPITMEAIVMLASNPGRVDVFSNMERAGVGLGVYEDYTWMFAVREGKSWRFARDDRPASVYQWVHVAGVFDGRNVVVFVEGKLQPIHAAVKTQCKLSLLPFLVGANPQADGTAYCFLHGLVDEIRVSNSVQYIKNFKPPERLANETDTILLLHFDEGAGDLAHDWSLGKHDGQIMGATWVDVRRGRVLEEGP